MPDTTLVEITLKKDVWTRLDSTFTENGLVTVKNIGGTAVSIYKTTETTKITDTYLEDLGINPIEIGGITYEVSNDTGERFWAKAVGAAGKVSVRIKGTLDPSEDITVLSAAINDLQLLLIEHKEDNTNPHKVTKGQVGLGNLPNCKTDAINSDKSDCLATAKAVKTVQDNLTNHKNDKDNPHEVTKDQTGLGQVANYPPANELTAIDTTNNAAYMTPAMTFYALGKWIDMAMNMAPQTIMQCKTSIRTSGWSNADCSAPSLVIEKVTNKQYRVNSGLQVAFADGGRTRTSAILNTAISVNIPTEDVSNSVLYIYVDLNEDGEIVSAKHTTVKPCEGMERTNTAGDFFNVAKNQIFDIKDVALRRVYVGKIYLGAGNISEVVPVPVGYEYRMPILTTMGLGQRTIFRNPFVGEVETVAEVEYSSSWGPTYWNDQIGVMATPYPGNPMDQFVVQVGLMGYLACGRESGSPFGTSFEAVTTQPRIRVNFTRKYR